MPILEVVPEVDLYHRRIVGETCVPSITVQKISMYVILLRVYAGNTWCPCSRWKLMDWMTFLS
jgi:hypothetical protein